MADQVRWFRSYLVREPDGLIGTFCIYGAEIARPSASTRAASACRARSLSPVATTVVVRPDPIAAKG